MSPSKIVGFIETIEEHPDGALHMQVEGLLENLNGLLVRHEHGPCLKQGHKRQHGPKSGTYTGCPRCRKITGDPFLGWRLELELDFICNGGDPTAIPEHPAGEEV